MDWNEETIARLRQLWQDGHSTAEIGRRMGITKNAVVGKAHRLELPARPSPIRRGTPDGPRPRRSTVRRVTGSTLPGGSASPRVVLSVAPVQPSVASIATPSSSAAEATPAAPPRPARSQPVMLRALPSIKPSARVTTCCWPIGDPGTPSFRFCDDGAMPNKPYCAQHAGLAYVKVRDRREDAA